MHSIIVNCLACNSLLQSRCWDLLKKCNALHENHVRKMRKKILLADNNTEDLKEIRTTLISHGYEVHHIETAEEIKTHLKKSLPDLILFSANLPNIDTNELAETSRKLAKDKFLPLVCSGYFRSIDERVALLETEVDDFIYKPVDPDEVAVRIANLLREVSAAEAKVNAEPVKGFNGSLKEMNLVDLIQTLEVGEKTGIITLSKVGFEGKVYITNGQIVNATLKDLDPLKVLDTLFLWQDGGFRVEMMPHMAAPGISKSTTEIIKEGATRLFRWNRLLGELPKLHTMVAVNKANLHHEIEEPEASISTYIGNSSKRIADIIEHSTLDELKVLRVIKSMLSKDQLSAARQGALNPSLNGTHPGNATNSPAHKPDSATVFTGVFKSLFKKQDATSSKPNERRHVDRRKTDRRHSAFSTQHKVHLSKAELIMVREKLVADCKAQNERNLHANR